MVTEQKLFDLFGDFTSLWPSTIQRVTGILGPGSSSDLTAWLAALNNGTQIKNTRTGMANGRVSVEAQLTFDNAQATYSGKPDGFPFVVASMPDVEFRIQSLIWPKFIGLFASASEGKAEVVLEGLPVEIRLPAGLVEPSAADPFEVTVGSFSPGSLDTLRVVLRRQDSSSIFVHVRILMNEDNEIVVRPAVPIDFGACIMSGIPIKTLHDLSLIASPALVPTTFDWIRHSVDPWFPDANGPIDGLFAFRSIEIDETLAPFSDISNALNSTSNKNPEAEFVLDDLVVPFFSPYVIPIPRHITVGVRRRMLDAGDIGQVFAFSQAPVEVFLSRDPSFGIIVNSIFYRSQPSEDLSANLGLTFSALVFFGGNNSAQHGFEIGLSENYTPLLGYRRGFSSSTGLPDPGTGAAATINALLHWEIATIQIDIMGFRGGYSLGRAFGEGKGFGDCFEFTGDIFVHMPPTGGNDSFFKMRSLDGQPAKFAIQGIGWKQGAFHFEGLASPDGVAIFFGPVKIIIEEFGLVAESGASYLSFSGGLGVDLPSGFSGALVFKRLRFRVSGNPNAPFFKLDGIFIALKFGTTLRVEAGGFYTEQEITPGTMLRQFALTGTVSFDLSAVKYLFALDVMLGSLRTPTPADSFDFFMFQVVFRGSVPIAWFEFRGARVLFARNMQPKLQPANNEAYELRYFDWYKATNPVTVPGDRRLAAWQPQQDSWALGIGVSASFAQLGTVLELGVFVLAVTGNDENGLLVVAEALLMQNPEPVAFIAVQWDGKNDQFSMLIGVNLTPKKFMKSVPDWIDKIAKITGTLFICNKPVVVALGRLSDTRTWFSLTFDFNIWVRYFVQFGLCFEYSEAPNGGRGFGLIVRLEGSINGGIIRVDFNAGFGFVAAVFTTSSNDYAASIWIEAGVRIVLFGFLRFGISARGEFRNVGSSPSRGEIRAEFRLETPWFLPDVTWTFEVQFGSVDPAGLATSVSYLRSSQALNVTDQKSQLVHVERIDPNWNGTGVANTLSIAQLRGMALDEAGRLTRFLANVEAKPVATDSSISIEFSIAVNDLIGIGGTASGAGNQKSNELRLSYDLIGLSVRRRARFGTYKSWHLLQEKVELTADFSDPSGVDLSGSFSPQQLTMFWAPDEQIDGQTVPKRLLLNSRTPFDYQTKNQQVDEQTVKNNPSWPCCGRDRKQPYPRHEVQFRMDLAGAPITRSRFFSASQSRFRFLRPTYAYPITTGAELPLGTIVAVSTPLQPGKVFHADLDQDAAVCYFRLLWPLQSMILRLMAFNAEGEAVGKLDVAPQSDFQNIMLPLSGTARRLEGWLIGPKGGKFDGAFLRATSQSSGTALTVDLAGYVTLRDYLDYLIGVEACDSSSDEFENAYSGRGAVSFLPNYEYEVALNMRITVTHPSKPSEAVEVKEYVYFKTKGLPGLNAAEVGVEVGPYVRSIYDGGRGTLYREEPVVIVFKDDFHVAVPLALRPPGTSEERNTLLQMKLLARPDIAQTLGTPFTATGQDWIVANRKVIIVDTLEPYVSALSKAVTVGTTIVSTSPFVARLEVLTMRPTATCPLPDPTKVVGTALIALPQGESDPADPSKQLWPANIPFTAMVKLEGSGFVDRGSFVSADLTAFDLAVDAGPGGGAAWSVANGSIVTTAGALRRFAIFGDPTWNYLSIELSIIQLGSMAGIGVALPAGNVPSRGLFAVVQPAGAGRRIAIFRRDAPGQFNEVAQVALPAAADPAAPVLLIVTAFDDKLRASVGDTFVEVDRDELREGRLCMIAQGACSFGGLRVTGMDIYRFPFQTSRFRSFAEHIGSFEGPVDVIHPNALGPGTTTTTTQALFSATVGQIAQVMQPSADSGARQMLFERWMHELGVPLKDEVNELELSRFEAASQTEFFVLESPEPLDFTEETTIEMTRCDKVQLRFPIVDTGIDVKVNRITRRKSIIKHDLSELLRLKDVLTSDGEKAPVILNVRTGHDQLELDIALDRLPDTLDRLLVVAAVSIPRGTVLNIYAFDSVRPQRRKVTTMSASKTDEILLKKGQSSATVSKALAALEPGAFALARADLKEILEIFRHTFVWTSVPIRILQDASGTKALIFPVTTGGVLAPQPSGSYRLAFKLNRKRWETTDPENELNHYQGTAVISVTLGT